MQDIKTARYQDQAASVRRGRGEKGNEERERGGGEIGRGGERRVGDGERHTHFCSITFYWLH